MEIPELWRVGKKKIAKQETVKKTVEQIFKMFPSISKEPKGFDNWELKHWFIYTLA